MPPLECPYKLIDDNGKPYLPASFPLRSDIPAPPPSIAVLPVDKRGYPVPFFTAWTKDHEPEFRGFNPEAQRRCISHRLCWVCGQPLKDPPVFVLGPMCAINRISAEPPSHAECARYSAIACPFLTKPQMVRRDAEFIEKDKVPGVMIERNPGVILLWFCHDYESFTILREPEGPLWFMLRAPLGVEWYARGRKATRAEVQASIDSGLPILEKEAAKQGTSHLLPEQMKKANRLLPRK